MPVLSPPQTNDTVKRCSCHCGYRSRHWDSRRFCSCAATGHYDDVKPRPWCQSGFSLFLAAGRRLFRDLCGQRGRGRSPTSEIQKFPRTSPAFHHTNRHKSTPSFVHFFSPKRLSLVTNTKMLNSPRVSAWLPTSAPPGSLLRQPLSPRAVLPLWPSSWGFSPCSSSLPSPMATRWPRRQRPS